ncbi:MAG: beta-glucosidase [Candidatus Hermodarchaeota archaeon]
MTKIQIKKGMTEQEINNFIDYALKEMTLEEKVYQMSGHGFFKDVLKDMGFALRPYAGAGLKRLDIPPLLFTDGPRGVIILGSTCFPVSMARAASWDLELEEKIGDVIGKEVRAHGGNLFGGVCINLLRHPGWGRAQETYGEDSYLVGEFGAALVRGVQKHNVMATAKHYAANSIEKNRFKINVEMDERTLREVYLPHFKRCVDQGCATIMSAYNKLRGEYCGHNKHLLRNILKEEWDFKGFVHSDWMRGLRDTLGGITGGLDIEMPRPKFYGRRLKNLVKKEVVSMELIDDAVRRIIRTILKYTTRLDPQVYDKSLVACEEHVKLAQTAAEKSMVLLKNQNNVLPLQIDKLKSIAIIGPLADLKNTGDHGSSNVKQKNIITPFQGFKDLIGDKLNLLYSNGSNIESAKQIASVSDAVILIVGYTYKDEGEWVAELRIGEDRENLNLHSADIELIKAISKVNPKTIVILVGGSAIMMEDWKDNVPAILIAWYSGMQGGYALANVIFGKVSPSGKLPFTIPKKISDLPYFKTNLDEIEYGYYHGYTKLEKESKDPAFPFGFGLSYSKFKYENLQIELQATKVIALVDISNVGKIAGEEVVQLYIGFENSKIERPIKLLKGFARVALQPIEKKQVKIEVNLDNLKWFNPEKMEWELEYMEYNVYVGGSSKSQDLINCKFT